MVTYLRETKQTAEAMQTGLRVVNGGVEETIKNGRQQTGGEQRRY